MQLHWVQHQCNWCCTQCMVQPTAAAALTSPFLAAATAFSTSSPTQSFSFFTCGSEWDM
jgi:hypothetical protein